MSGSADSKAAQGRDTWLYACAYAIMLLALDFLTGFHVGINDFWGNYYHADILDFGDARSLYNGFFPVGYPVLLWSAPGQDYVEAGFAISAASRILFLGSFGMLAARLLPGAWALAATVALSIVPRIFENALTPSSDLPMLAASFGGGACALLAVIRDRPRRSRLALVLFGGTLLGLSGLLRQHGLVLAAGFLLGAFAVRPRAAGFIALSALACAAAYAPQIAVNLLADRGPLETAQYVNIYKMVHGVELHEIPLDLQPDLRAIVAEDPAAFGVAWARYFVGMLPVLLSPALAALFVRDAAIRKAGVFAIVAGVPYLAAVALGWSARAVLPMIPWAVLLAACVLQRTQTYVASRLGRGALLNLAGGALALLLAVWASERNAVLVRYYLEDHHRYSEVESAVRADGLVHPKQLYTTDGSLYLPLMRPHWPYFDGTWAEFSMYRYAERYPRLNLDSLSEFQRECVRQGITHVALASNARDVSPALGELFEDPQAHAAFEYLGHVGGYALFRREG